ncbi:WNT7B protein, partial [Acromyrmex insinuator]
MNQQETENIKFQLVIESVLAPVNRSVYSLLVKMSKLRRVVGAVVVGAAVCSRIPGLAKSQREQCRKAPHAMPAVGEGAALGLRECRHQFRHHRWNCSHVSNDQVFGHVVVVEFKIEENPYGMFFKRAKTFTYARRHGRKAEKENKRRREEVGREIRRPEINAQKSINNAYKRQWERGYKMEQAGRKMQDKIPCKTKWESFSLSSELVPGDDLSAEGREMKVRRDDERDRYNSAYFSVEKCQRQPARWIPVWIELWTGSKEAAFTYAISSAGVTYAVTAACSRGNITACGCEPAVRTRKELPPNGWEWGGCSADVTYGMRFARRFLDAREIEGDARSLMNLHNNKAGRKIVKALLQTECKCHGVSGSCTVRTCWRTLPSFRQIGDALMKKYRRAKPVMAITPPPPPTIQTLDAMSHSMLPEMVPILGNDAKTQGKPNDFAKSRHNRQPLLKKINKSKKYLVLSTQKRSKDKDGSPTISSIINPKRIPKRSELVYLQPSPNYCEPDLAQGSLGTQGRYCNRTSTETDGCDLMCCGRGYNTHQFTRTWQCRCKFHWCCRVHCETCMERTEEYTCK